MTWIAPPLPASGYVVPAPRSTDAIGAALRGAYAGEQPAPEAILAVLRALDHA